jgi:hypothetical protein
MGPVAMMIEVRRCGFARETASSGEGSKTKEKEKKKRMDERG